MTKKVIDCQEVANAHELLVYLQLLQSSGYPLREMYVRIGETKLDPRAEGDEIAGACTTIEKLSDGSAAYDLVIQ